MTAITYLDIFDIPLNDAINRIQDAAKQAEHDGWVNLSLYDNGDQTFLNGEKREIGVVLKPCGRCVGTYGVKDCVECHGKGIVMDVDYYVTYDPYLGTMIEKNEKNTPSDLTSGNDGV